MVQLSILSGKTAGTNWVARRFPVRIGRGSSCDLRLEEDGVWDDHLRLESVPGEGFVLETAANALACVNGQPAERAVLCNGDLLEIGSVKLQFWLSPTLQTGLWIREGLTWAGIALISLGQIALVYWLLQERP
jgi:type III secretion system (T3SS) inner membrane Yop/YscD-like protein